MNWAAQEMAGVALGDQRLNRRSARLLETMATHPDASIPARSTDLAESMAAYRFLANERFDEQQILSPHIEKTDVYKRQALSTPRHPPSGVTANMG